LTLRHHTKKRKIKNSILCIQTKEKNRMNKKFSITLLVVMFSLLIIGFGGTATVEAAGKCAETLLANVSASESTAFTDCRALQADAARYTGLATFYTNETNVQRALEANAARYTGLATFYTNETNVQRALEANAARYTGLTAFYTAEAAGKCLEIASIDMKTVEFDNCLSDSAYLAANPELMVVRHFAGVVENEEVTGSAYFAENPELMASRRFVVANRSTTVEPVSDSAYLAANPELMVVRHFAGVVENEEVTGSAYFAENPELMASRRFVVADGSMASQPVFVDIEVQRYNNYNALRGHSD
jgi:hypothetical protein